MRLKALFLYGDSLDWADRNTAHADYTVFITCNLYVVLLISIYAHGADGYAVFAVYADLLI